MALRCVHGVKAVMDHFIAIGGSDDAAAAESIRQQEIDVLVDLQGLTSGARPNILAYRPAPLQITYLGFPGPTGLPCIDYVIANWHLIPDAEKPFTVSRPLYLPVFNAVTGNALLRRCRVVASAVCRRIASSSVVSTTTISSPKRCSAAGCAFLRRCLAVFFG